MTYRIREYGPAHHRSFMVQENHPDGIAWSPCPYAPDFWDLAQAKAWIRDYTAPPTEDVYHLYP